MFVQTPLCTTWDSMFGSTQSKALALLFLVETHAHDAVSSSAIVQNLHAKNCEARLYLLYATRLCFLSVG